MRISDRLLQRARRVQFMLTGVPSVELVRSYGATIGDRVAFARGVEIDTEFAWLVTIEDGAVLAPGVYVLAHDAAIKRLTGKTLAAEVRICEEAYVGAHSIILPGVTVGRNAVIGAGSVVTREVPPATVWAGVPARQLRTAEELAEAHRPFIDDAIAAGMFGWSQATRHTAPGRREIRARIGAAGRAYVE